MTEYINYVTVFKRMANSVFDGWIGHAPSIDITQSVMATTLAECENKLRRVIYENGEVGGEKATTIEYRSIYPDSIVTMTYVETA